jgi:transcriptional regulator GlxA family with amidase domain
MARKDPKLVAFVVYPGVTPLDLVGPLTVLRDLKVGTRYRSVVVGERLDPVPTDAPLAIAPARTFDEVAHPFALFVPGGGTATVTAMRDEPLVAYVRQAAEGAAIVGSTGNGALLLGAAGLLGGRKVAAHWAWKPDLEAMGATVVPDRWVDDGRFLTAAGGSAGIDAMLHLTARLRSEGAAKLAQLWMEYDPQPPFGRPDPVTADSPLGAVLRGRAG